MGNGQLQQYDATSNSTWLSVAESSFRAAIACEGKDMEGKEPPPLIAEQEWWKKRMTKPAEQQQSTTVKPAASKTGPTTSKAPTATTGRQPTQTTAGRGTIGAKPQQPSVAGRGRQQPAVNKPAVGGAARGRGVSAAGKPGSSGAPIGRGKTPATLGELKSGGGKQPAKPGSTLPTKPATTTNTSKPTTTTSTTAADKSTQQEQQDIKQEAATLPPAKANSISYIPRLGLARTLAKRDDKTPKDECISFYEEVIKMAGHIHDAYIELGEILAKTLPLKAVDVYSKFPFSDPPSFDDAYLHGEIIRILMKETAYDDPRLSVSMISMGRALGIGVLDKHVAVLEGKFKTALLREVYAGVHGKSVDDPGLVAFFKFKCWT